MTVGVELSAQAPRLNAALCASVAAIRQAAATVELVALSHEADAERRLALRMWARAAALESATN